MKTRRSLAVTAASVMIVSLWPIVAVSAAALDPSAPVCLAADKDSPDCARENDDNLCPVWESFGDGWILAGRSIRRLDAIVGLRPDVVIPWKRHSRRAFPLWGRHSYFFRNTNHSSTTLNIKDELFVFAPGLHWPLECHKQHANVKVDYDVIFENSVQAWYDAQTTETAAPMVQLNPPIVADRAIAFGDPIFLPCTLNDEWPLGHTTVAYEDFPTIQSSRQMKAFSTCWDPFRLEVRSRVMESTTKDISGQYGVYTGRSIPRGSMVTWGSFIPMHRTELHNAQDGSDELLLNYCYGHANSSLLLLPLAPTANAMNHAAAPKANVRVQWDRSTVDPEKIFIAPTTKLFQNKEMTVTLNIVYVALRDIKPGEELLLDYGPDWQDAWTKHMETVGNDRDFRYVIGLPDDMLPPSWLAQETLLTAADLDISDEWLLPTLSAAQVQPIALESGRAVSGQVDRVGLPDGLADSMARWADRIGLTEIMKSYVLGDASLPADGEQRLRLNGGTWWVKRFPDVWRSDMHYISPDDVESNSQFMQALADAGFDSVIEAVGRKDNLTSITVYYPSFIAVSHCTNSYMHEDSNEEGHYNIIFPVLQTSVPGPELVLGDEDKSIYVPYKYESDHAVVLGKNGLHGTAPCDYRASREMRMVVSVYMVDADLPETKQAVLDQWVGADPPFPRPEDRSEFLDTYKHWKRTDPSKSLSNPF
jgi:SET domain